MADVWMKHPSLPDNPAVRVPESAVPHHMAAGWELAEPPASKPRLPLPPADAEPPAGQGLLPEQDGAAEDPAPAQEADPKPKRTRKASTTLDQES